MFSSIRYIGFFLSVVLVFSFAGCKNPATPASTTYYIDGISGNDSNPGDQDNPFERLTHAVNTAAPGDTLMILPGTYSSLDGESFPITLKAGQRLIGDPGSNGIGTILVGDGDVGGGYTTTILAAEGCILSGLEIQDSDTSNSYFGIFAEDSTVSVSSCSFTAGYGGVFIEGTGDSLISSSVFRNSSYGVYIAETTGSNTIDDNDMEGGMVLPITVVNAGSGTVISNNSITGNGSLGISLQNGNPLVVGNTFNYNNPSDTDGYTNGAIVNSSSTARVRDNTFDCHSPAVLIKTGFDGNGSALDLGTASDPGGNDFTDATGPSIVINSGVIVDIYAVGNTFPNNPPSSGTSGDINNSGDAAVYYTATDSY